MSDTTDSDDDEELSVREKAQRNKENRDRPVTMGAFGSTMQQIDQKARNDLRKSAAVYDPCDEFEDEGDE